MMFLAVFILCQKNVVTDSALGFVIESESAAVKSLIVSASNDMPLRLVQFQPL